MISFLSLKLIFFYFLVFIVKLILPYRRKFGSSTVNFFVYFLIVFFPLY